MDSKNKNLHAAKVAKNDEFYTLPETIEAEILGHDSYKPHFEGKTVLCNCDDPFESAFCKFFLKNFNYLKLKRLICTSYAGSPIIGKENEQLSLFDEDNEPVKRENGYVLDIKNIPMKNGRGVSDDDIRHLLNRKRGGVKKLEGDGSFDSPECLKYLKEADIVVTNPPFSNFRPYVALLMKYNKKFLVLGNNNAITYKEIFPLLKDNKMWLGYTSNKTCVFEIPDTYPTWDKKETAKRNNGKHYAKVPAISWFTNLDISKRHEDLDLYERYYDDNGKPTKEALKKYPRYDNYDAINVDKVCEIPKDYEGVMGVPITFLDKFSVSQFQVLGLTCRGYSPEYRTKLYSKENYKNANDLNGSGCILVNGTPKMLYGRLLIQKKSGTKNEK